MFGLAKLTKFREMRKIHFKHIDYCESKEVLEYLVSNCPDKLRIFAFEADDSCSYADGDFYMKGIKKVSVWTI